MTFLAPLLAWLTGLAAVPIIIHLLTRRRFRTVSWAAMEFVLATVRRSQRRLQFRDLVLMLLRAAALALLALAAARPALLGRTFRALAGGAEVAAVVVLDNSMSMRHAAGTASRLERAKEMAGEAIESLPTGSAAAVLLASDIVVEPVGEPSHDLGLVAAAVREAPASDGGTNLGQALRRAWDALRRRPAAEREIYVATDMQAAGWPAGDNPDFRRLVAEMNAARPRGRLVLLDAGDGRVANLALEQVRCSDELVASGERVTVAATLRRYGPAPAGAVIVDCFLADGAGEPRKVASRAVSLDGQRNEVAFDLAPAGEGTRRIELRAAADALPADNAARTVVHVVEKLRVLIVDGGADDEGASPGEAEFLLPALAARGADDTSRIVPEVVNRYQLPARPLERYHVVVLANAGGLPADTARRLVRRVRAEGMGLIVFAGHRVGADAYDETFVSSLLPARPGPPVAPAGDVPVHCSVSALEHPVVRYFDDPDRRALLAAPSFGRFRRMATPRTDTRAADDGARVVLGFEDAQPAALERAAGRGRVLLFAFDASRNWSDLPLHPVYLILARRAVQHVALADRRRRTVSVHEPLVRSVPLLTPGTGEVLTPGGSARRCTAEPAPGGQFSVLRFDATHEAGFYRMTTGGDGEATYAVNCIPVESDLTPLTEADLRSRWPDLPMQWIGAGDHVGSAVARMRTGSEVWLHLLVLAGLCLLAEQGLAAFWAPKRL